MNTKQTYSIYQVKVTLKGSKPPIWRRLLVPSTIDLARFHHVLQTVMGWSNCHLHHFIQGRTIYGSSEDKDEDIFDLDIKDEKKYKLSQLLKEEKDTLLYEYDFGDGWEHQIILEKKLPYDSSKQIPICLKGKRACPPEDCGGIWGYKDLLEIINDPSHPEHKETLEWLGRDFDPEYFGLDETNAILSKYNK